MTSTFRTAGAWGAGVGRPLTWVEQDNNTYDKEQRLADLESLISVTGGGAVGIDHITVSGDQMTIYMTDSSIQGPFTLPSVAWNATGLWLPNHVYQALDVVASGGSAYLVNVDHTSDATFDPEAMEGTVPRYSLILTYAPLEGFTRSAATFTPALEDANSYNRLTNASGCAVTIDNSVPFADWTELHFRDCSTDTNAYCTFAITGGGVFNGVTGFLNQTNGTGSTVGMKKVGATDDWDIWGLLAVAP